MIQSMMLRQRKSCYDPKDLAGVLPLLSVQLFDFLFLPCYAAVKDIICTNLLVMFFRQLRRFKILVAPSK